MPGAVVGNATRIWELNVHWALYSQCGIWDPKGRGVDIWECIRDRKFLSITFFLSVISPPSASFIDDSTPGTQVCFIARALPFVYILTIFCSTLAAKRNVLEIRCPKMIVVIYDACITQQNHTQVHCRDRHESYPLCSQHLPFHLLHRNLMNPLHYLLAYQPHFFLQANFRNLGSHFQHLK